MRETQLCFLVISILETLDEARKVHAATADDLTDVVVAHARNVRQLDDGVAEFGSDTPS